MRHATGIPALFSRFYFNPRTREECDKLSSSTMPYAASFQSTHSRGVRRVKPVAINCVNKISIHALARSATPMGNHINPDLYISIHALARSATISSRDLSFTMKKFQSTHSRGVRQKHSEKRIAPCRISIHALARSAT